MTSKLAYSRLYEAHFARVWANRHRRGNRSARQLVAALRAARVREAL